MKIGIVTYHRAHNYGACLQALATRLFLEQMGHEAYYVDYWPAHHAATYKLFSFYKLFQGNFKGRVNYILNIFKNIPEKKERIRNFESFIEKFILPYCRPVTEEFDAILYGSDQIWRKFSYLNDYDPVYFGKNSFKCTKHISFAASMGNLPETENDKCRIKELVSNLTKITIREEDLELLLNELGYKEAIRIVDPTLLLSSNQWMNVVPIPQYVGKPYVLVYYVSKSSFDMNEIKKFAERRGLEIKILCGYARSHNLSYYDSTAGPLQFLSMIKNASYTFVSSFHGLAFSLIFGKEFYVSLMSNYNRIMTLLNLIGEESRMLHPKSRIPEMKSIDYDKVHSILANESISVNRMLHSYFEE